MINKINFKCNFHKKIFFKVIFIIKIKKKMIKLNINNLSRQILYKIRNN